jgi:hypothetical protein
LFTLGSFLNDRCSTTFGAIFSTVKVVHNFWQYLTGLGYFLGDFVTNPSGHPASKVRCRQYFQRTFHKYRICYWAKLNLWIVLLTPPRIWSPVRHPWANFD